MQKSIIDIVREQPRVFVDSLYMGKAESLTNPQGRFNVHASQAIFQSLSAYAKLIVMRVLYTSESFTLHDITLHLLPMGDVARNKILEELISLYILVPAEVATADDPGVDDDVMIVDELLTKTDGISTHIKSKRPYTLNPSFQASFQTALLTPQHPWADFDPTTVLNTNPRAAQYTAPTPTQIMENLHERWNMMLQFLVGMVPASAFKTNVVVPFTYYAGLMSLKPRTTDVFEITEKGYVFMLKNMANQIWDYVIAQISREALSSTDRVEVLSFLFALAYTRFGEGYPVSALTKAQKQLMFELSEVGLLYLRDKKAPWFYPTPEAINLVFGARTVASSSSSATSTGGGTTATASSSSSSVDQAMDRVTAQAQPATTSTATRPLQIIVETNLQVTAYVSTPLHVALLKIFVDVSVQLPNMVIGRLTRDKSKNAFRMGMKTSRIIDFLTTHAHPHVMHKRQQAIAAAAHETTTTTASTSAVSQHQVAAQSILPANVIDQLQLWENELYRMDMTEAMVVDLRDLFFVSYDRFRVLVSDLQSAKLLLWVSDKGEKLVSCRHCPEAEAMIQRFVAEGHPKYTY